MKIFKSTIHLLLFILFTVCDLDLAGKKRKITKEIVLAFVKKALDVSND